MIHIATALLLFCAGQDDKAKEEEAKKKIADFQKEIARAKPDDRPACIDRLAEMKHPKILEELIKWLTKPDAECQKSAARHVGGYTQEAKAAEALLKAAQVLKAPELIKEMLDAIGAVGFKGVAGKLAIFYDHESIDVAKAAVDATGALKSRDGVQPLIDLAQKLDAIREDSAPPPGPAPVPVPPTPPRDDQKVKRKKEVLPTVISALKEITREKFNSVKEWIAWWAKNAKTFKDK